MTTVDLGAGPGGAPKSALAIGAHPDDIEFGCGATLARWAAGGCRVEYLVLTDGSKGSWDPGEDLAALVATRKREQQEAATAIGAGGVTFLDYVDGELQSGLGERERVCAAIRVSRPTVVLGHDPWKRYRLHPDHRHAGLLAAEGVVAARDPHFFPGQGLAAHRPSHLLLWEADEVDHLEGIEGFLEAKLAALACHRSQWRSTMRVERDPDREWPAFERRVRARAEEAGRPAGLAAAEAFKRLDLD